MSTWDVKIHKISEVKSHPNADALDLVFIDGWQLVTRKGDYKIDDLVAYFPEGTIIPQPHLERMGLKDKLSGAEKNRVKTIRLRGEYSIGILDRAPPGFNEGDSVAEYYGATKYEPPIPAQLSGKVRSHHLNFIKYDVENINNYKSLLQEGEIVSASTKIHGCFHGDSLVLMENGTYKKIADIIKNDIIVSYNTKTNLFEKNKVVYKINSGKSDRVSWIRLKFDNNTSIVCTSNHLFLTKNRGWISACNLNSDDIFVVT